MWWNDFESVTFTLNKELKQVSIAISYNPEVMPTTNIIGVFHYEDARYLACIERQENCKGYKIKMGWSSFFGDWGNDVEPLCTDLSLAPEKTNYEIKKETEIPFPWNQKMAWLVPGTKKDE